MVTLKEWYDLRVGLGHEDRVVGLEADVLGRSTPRASRSRAVAGRADAGGVAAEVVGIEIDRLAEHVDLGVTGTAVASVVDVAVDRVHRHVVGGPDGVDLEVATGLGDEDARGIGSEDVEHVEHAVAVQHVDVDLEVVARIADSADVAGESGEHRDVDAAYIGPGRRGCRRERRDRVGRGLSIVLGIDDPPERPDRHVVLARRDVVDPEIAEPLLDVDERVGEQDDRAATDVVRVGVDDARVADRAAGEVAHRDVVAGGQVRSDSGGPVAVVDRAARLRRHGVVLSARGKQVVAEHRRVAGGEAAEFVVRARATAVVCQRTIGPPEPVDVVGGEIATVLPHGGRAPCPGHRASNGRSRHRRRCRCRCRR